MSGEESESSYQIAESVLEAIARRALEGEKRARLHTGGIGRGRNIDVSVEGLSYHAVVHLDGSLGEDLIQVGTEIQGKIARALTRMTGCAVAAVDVVFDGVYAPVAGE